MSLADDARRLNLRARRRHRAGDDRRRAMGLPALILMTDSRRPADPVAAVAHLPRGSAVILRHDDIGQAARAALARKLRAATRARHVLLLIAAEDGAPCDLARAVAADGIHLSERVLRRGFWRAMRGHKPGWLITAAAHSPVALRLAATRGCDAALLSPVFATASHPEARPLGAVRFAAWAGASGVPVYALGGVDRRTAPRLRPTQAYGLAAIGGLSQPVCAPVGGNPPTG